MPKEKANKLLHQLRTEIEQQASLPDSDKQRMGKLVEDIEQGLNEDNISDELNNKLADTVTEFEATHPRLTAIINDIMITLSNMGI